MRVSHLEATICAVIVGLLMLLAMASAQSEPPQPVPHDQQPSHCSNARAAKAPHRCDCKKTPGVGCDVEDVKCLKYCKPHKCFCWHDGCDS